MKSISGFAIALAILAAGCHPSYQSANSTGDDVYYSSKTDPGDYTSDQPSNSTTGNNNNGSSSSDQYADQNQADNSGNQSGESRFDYSGDDNQNAETTTSENKDGNTYITNNYYDEDDYYDYAYTARIRRFHYPGGWGYYDNYYTNSYWYDYNPYSWGVSIYMGYNWWGPGYYYSGHPYYSYWGYQPYPYPYYTCNAGYYNGYWNGYYQGYYNGLYGGCYNNPYYYNSYDFNTHYYYGPRGSSGKNTRNGTKPIAQLYENNIRAERTAKAITTGTGTVRNTSVPAKGNAFNEVKNGGNVKQPVTKNGTSNQGNTGGVKAAGSNNQVRHENDGKNANGNNTGGVKPSKETVKNNSYNPEQVKQEDGDNYYTPPVKQNASGTEKSQRGKSKTQKSESSYDQPTRRTEKLHGSENKSYQAPQQNNTGSSGGGRQQSAPSGGVKQGGRR